MTNVKIYHFDGYDQSGLIILTGLSDREVRDVIVPGCVICPLVLKKEFKVGSDARKKYGVVSVTVTRKRQKHQKAH